MTDLLNRIFKLSELIEKDDFLQGLFGRHVLDVINGTSQIVLFGAGDVGKDLCEVLQLHGIHPECFCDNNTSNVGNQYYGVPVISFTELKDTCRDHLIIVASCNYASEIRRQLLDHAFPEEHLISVAPIRHPELLRYYRHCVHYTQNQCQVLSMQDLIDHEEELLRTYDLLADEKSRELFIARLSLLASKIDFTGFSNYVGRYSEINEKERDTLPFYVSPEDYGYFNNDVFSLKDNEVLVDGGSFNGLSAATFAETCKRKNLKYQKIYCFEPIAGNFKALMQNTSHLPNVTCIQRGLWSTSAVLTFLSGGEYDPEAFIETCRDRPSNPCAIKTELQTISIDEQFPDEDITFIKMDIEGAELEAVQGAAKVIRRCRPKMAISAYHKRSDIYTLPLLIHSLSPSYRLFLRQYGYTLYDMVLFAIPSDRDSL